MSPLRAGGEGIKGWGTMAVGIITNYADMISLSTIYVVIITSIKFIIFGMIQLTKTQVIIAC
ncbi:hypothetical protein VF04_09080 [Nostoc linckia z7]|uniref:Uncharacterized protein n=1 Tax=Nostoc linckia z7 TaxID=1628745 RepID=A0ABX4KRJ3_NOSLI|nr:hypothetical protein VF04_09080 [Nostoc linckia z7]